MEATVTLKHAHHSLPKRIEYFYDGLAVAENGLLTLPVNEMEHLKAAYFRGYMFTPDGTWLKDFVALEDYVQSQTAKSAEEDIDESTDNGRQPNADNRIRSSQRKGRAKTNK